MVPSARSFFEEVRATYADAATVLGLSGPTETELILPVSAYRGGAVVYEVSLDIKEGVECSVSLDAESVTLTVDVELLAIAAGVVERRGGISTSARNLRQLRKSLQGQADYLQRVHLFLTDAATAEDLMRRAGAREWDKGAT
ncbi:hypothetical protein ABZ307_34730 [Streptomyces griseorubiginosus]|uniref:hypothetical protein n=1 Tax=Streptomyces griseorubiginosus TaxID=67304 RepID=UPI0033BAB61A